VDSVREATRIGSRQLAQRCVPRPSLDPVPLTVMRLCGFVHHQGFGHCIGGRFCEQANRLSQRRTEGCATHGTVQ
jgi:hypothetical protein